MDHPPENGLWVVMGVAGAGKTTVGRGLAGRLDVPWADADDFHPSANVAKMRAGIALDDDDRGPWLAAVGSWLADRHAGAVMCCSALRRSYRDVLRFHAGPVFFLHLAGPAEVVRARVEARTDHFMPASLVESQYAALQPLESDEDGITVGFDERVDQIIGRALAFTRHAAPRLPDLQGVLA